ncbi:HET-domain-containing protein [Leucogyrophana mollusca]|uniref:HET-domain-containing protein n=1 Tax=Leucogyrophana mollusca TaxID=85980 RepID=A0ACB8BLS8_9AGAM|nr:HET-domain-containing protein [Leucogyrophana mollusca]
MRLLNTRTLILEEPQHGPEYAILSHVWGDNEVTFRDISRPHAIRMKGYAKIEHSCAQALADGYEYIWIDTCCIDKSSSAELSEAINSMYRWYEEAVVCYAYLEDVRSDEDPAAERSRFRRSKWFTRGWTLQEAIAPRRVIFFAGDWVKIGTRFSLIHVIAEITGVDEQVLLAARPLTDVSVAKKMSWASWRETTRLEDRAYSLMGIFGVHMPLIYGEGKNAFIRLQYEIMRTSNDQSIFAWSYDDWNFHSGLLATSPDNFRYSTKVDRIPPTEFIRIFASAYDATDYKSHFSVTNSGVQISTPVQTTRTGFVAALACSDDGRVVGLRLHHTQDGLYQRLQVQLFPLPKNPRFVEDFIVTDMIISTTSEKSIPSPIVPNPFNGLFTRIRVRAPQIGQEGFVLHTHSLERKPQTEADGSFIWEPTTPDVKFMLAYYNRASGEGFVVTIGGGRQGCPCVHIEIFTDIKRMKYTFFSGDKASSCCKNSPDWAFKTLRGGKRVTVAAAGLDESQNQYVVNISVDRPKCAEIRRRVLLRFILA